MTTQLSRWSRRMVLVGCALALPLAANAQTAPKVKFQTNQGDFVVEVYPDKAPKSAENFLQYVKDKHYDGTIFHRIIDNFMVQGGGFTVDMKQKQTRAPIPLEANNGLKNNLGTIAMARTMDPNSATAQFFVNVKDNDFLNAKGAADGYAVFGKVITGMDVIQKIKVAPTGPGDVPKTPIVINSATLVK